MKKCLIFTLILMLLCAPALAKTKAVVDDAHLLDGDERAELEEKVQEIYDEHHFQLVFYTTPDKGSKSMAHAAADFYDYNGYGYGPHHDGMIFMLSMAERDYVTVTTGMGIAIFTDEGISLLEEKIVPLLSDGEFGNAFLQYAQYAKEYLTEAAKHEDLMAMNVGQVSGALDVPVDVSKIVWDRGPVETANEYLGIIFLAAAVIGGIVLFLMIHGMKTARKHEEANDYMNDVNVTRRADMFLYATETRRKIERETSSGGGGGGSSSTFSGSSGTSHGGGNSGKF